MSLTNNTSQLCALHPVVKALGQYSMKLLISTVSKDFCNQPTNQIPTLTSLSSFFFPLSPSRITSSYLIELHLLMKTLVINPQCIQYLIYQSLFKINSVPLPSRTEPNWLADGYQGIITKKCYIDLKIFFFDKIKIIKTAKKSKISIFVRKIF